MDDRETGLLLPGSDDEDDEGPRLSIRNIVISILLFALIAPLVCLMVYGGFQTVESIGRLKISMEPVAYTGLGFAADGGPAPAASSPSFNVTLRAKSTYGWVKFCSVKEGRMEVSYSGVPIAVTDGVAPFCVDAAGGEKVIAATVSSGWPALPDVFRERMQGDRRHGGVQIQVDFSFWNKDHAHPNDELTWWVRCPTMLNSDQPSSCRSYTVRGCSC